MKLLNNGEAMRSPALPATMPSTAPGSPASAAAPPTMRRVIDPAVSARMRSIARKAGPEPAARAGFSVMSTRLEECLGALTDWSKASVGTAVGDSVGGTGDVDMRTSLS